MIVSFSELSEIDQQNRIDQYREFMITDGELVEHVVDQVKRICRELFNNPHLEIHYSVGASDDYFIMGMDEWRYSPGAVRNIIADYPQDFELHKILNRWQTLQRKHFYKLHGDTKFFRSSMTVDTYKNETYIDREIENEMETIMRDLAYHFLKWVRDEFEYQTSDQTIREFLFDVE